MIIINLQSHEVVLSMEFADLFVADNLSRVIWLAANLLS